MIDKLYFKRQEIIDTELSNDYKYDFFPKEFRVQIYHILTDVFYDVNYSGSQGFQNVFHEFNGDFTTLANNTNSELRRICKIFSREKGRLSLKSNTNGVSSSMDYGAILEFILSEENVDDILTIVELVFDIIETKACNEDFGKRNDAYEISKKAILELNQRFREHSIGYQYENGQIVRLDSELIHTEAVKPALQLLSNPIYKGAQKEFLNAHEHYRQKRYSEALIECLKAYESTLKIILDKNKWEYSSNATADELTGRVMQSGLVPEFWQQHFKSLKNTLTSGVPTARNKVAGHGAGNEIREIPEYLVSYILHMTASTIVFLVKADEDLE
ncbi:STM4504/CBY_0614 family protein [Psychrobacter sp. DM8]|uniref:STM4504/CBY_0614 family protein n=1 Tax=Psychrobacter sp. DM8 TaxID=3440636 RepID=UPI003F50BC14